MNLLARTVGDALEPGDIWDLQWSLRQVLGARVRSRVDHKTLNARKWKMVHRKIERGMTHAVPKAVVHTKIETTVQEAAGDPQHVSIERVQINITPEASQRACP